MISLLPLELLIQVPVGVGQCLVDDASFNVARHGQTQQVAERWGHIDDPHLSLQLQPFLDARSGQDECAVLPGDAKADRGQLFAVRAVELRPQGVDHVSGCVTPEIDHLCIVAREGQRKGMAAGGGVGVGVERGDYLQLGILVVLRRHYAGGLAPLQIDEHVHKAD